MKEVVSSASTASWFEINKSHISILSNKGPRTDPCETPNAMLTRSSKVEHILFFTSRC